MIESFVDLTYRGLALGRRIRLCQVRPSTGYLELPAPMPVGAQIAITAEDGTTFEATVTGVHEQVAGADRTPGMVVAPALAGEPAHAWWQARVTLSDDDAHRPRPVTAGGRSRPVTVRPRSHTDPMPLPTGAATAEAPAIIADLEARVAAAAGVEPPVHASRDVHEMPTVALPALALPPDAAAEAPARADRDGMPTIVMPVAELEVLTAASSSGDGDPATTLTMPPAADHEVVDDGSRTMIMSSIDPAVLAAAAEPTATGAPDDGGPDDGDDGDAGDDADVTDPGDPRDPAEAGAAGDTIEDPPTVQPGRGRRKRRSRR